MAEATVEDDFPKTEHSLLAATDPNLPLEERQAACVQRFVDLGLGRGVDATSDKPWIEKSSFQACDVRFDLIMGTDEGGSVEVYESVVQSVQALQLDMKSSVSSSSEKGSVKIGLDGEHTRTSSTNRRVVGRKILNRTVSFREEVPLLSRLVSSKLRRKEVQRSPSGSEIPFIYEHSFDNFLCLWVLEKISQEYPALCEEDLLDKVIHSTSPFLEFVNWYKEVEGRINFSKLQSLLTEICHSFINHFHITHYVFSIELGAMEYSVMTEREYYQTLHKVGTGDVNNMVSTHGQLQYTSKRKEMSHLSKKVGCIHTSGENQYTVPRGTYAEAVIESRFKPLTTLVTHASLRRCFRTALSRYIDKQSDSSVGPFFISALGRTGEIVYFRVIEADMTLTATVHERQASEFYVIQSNDKIYDFHIIYLRHGTKRSKRTILMFTKNKDTSIPIPHYLCTPLTMLGRNDGPLTLELNPKNSDTLFHLHSRLMFQNCPSESIGPWVQGREAYFLNCYGRKYAKDGYLAIRCVREEDKCISYRPVCVPSRKYSKDHLMIFRLTTPSSLLLEQHSGYLPEHTLPGGSRDTPESLLPYRFSPSPEREKKSPSPKTPDKSHQTSFERTEITTSIEKETGPM